MFVSSCWVTSNIHIFALNDLFRAHKPNAAPAAGMETLHRLVGADR